VQLPALLTHSNFEKLQKEFNVLKLVEGYRTRGHLFTKTNPVRERRTFEPDLDIS
jgi:2-oxoglutarate dehydrogenase E1 component